MMNDAYSRNNLLQIKDGAFVINVGEFKSTETYWIALFLNAENAIHFNDSFVV